MAFTVSPVSAWKASMPGSTRAASHSGYMKDTSAWAGSADAANKDMAATVVRKLVLSINSSCAAPAACGPRLAQNLLILSKGK
jgi:hypothetical protein